MSFSNKVVIVTGASSGIGAVTAIMFAKEGAEVAIVGRNETNLKIVAEKCAKVGNKPLVIKADVSNDNEAKTIVKRTVNAFGRLDILINNAAIYRSSTMARENYLSEFDNLMATNLRSVVHITALAAPYLIKVKGNIINISSITGTTRVTAPYLTPFGVSKYCLSQFSRCAAVELSPLGVRVNTVSPEGIITNMIKDIECEFTWSDFPRHSAIKKTCEPEEVGDIILYLASDKAKSITGANYVIDNGMQIRK